MLPDAISNFYVDIAKKSFTAKVCLFHQRFSTNTQPRWHLAQPFRLLAHNGEINAIRGNRNWVKARASKFSTPLIPGISKFKSLVNETGSDSSALDNMIELLVKGGINLFRSIRMVLPPAWQERFRERLHRPTHRRGTSCVFPTFFFSRSSTGFSEPAHRMNHFGAHVRTL